jgi:RNA polymerase sigma factor (sigma-70 family)
MSVARSLGGDRDAAMDRYSYMLGKLRESDFRRLRSFDPTAGASFATWLTVTARHLCLDHQRSLFGRGRPEHETDQSTTMRAVRRALQDLTEGDTPADSIPDSSARSADAAAVRGELDSILQDELAKLTPSDRLLLTLRFEDDLPASRIAGVLGLKTPFHVYRRLNAILAQMRRGLESKGIEGSDG